MANKLDLKYLILGALLAALTTVGGYLSVPVGPAPFTLQTLFVVLTGLVLPRTYAVITMFIHLLLMMIISGANPFSPTFGFLIGFMIAMLTARSLHRMGVTTTKNKIIRVIIMTLIIYAIGLPYMYIILNHVLNIPMTLWQTIFSGLIIFIPSDIIKYVIAIILANRVETLILKS